MTAPSSDSRFNRRRFLKYAGATAAVIGGAAASYLYGSSFGRGTQVTTSTAKSAETVTSAGQNHPPVASFKRKPWYLDPTDQQMIQFASNCYDADNDPLQYAWYIDGTQRSLEKNYSTGLTAGEHGVELKVSDGTAEDNVQQSVAVDPDQMYPTRTLHLKYKGVRYFAGWITPEWASLYNPSEEEMSEQLDTIHNELGCNAVAVCGGEPCEERMIECANMAIDKGFDRIYVQPSYVNATVDETIDKVGKFAVKVKSLRETSDAIVYMVGHEFQLETSIIRGDNYWERWANANKGTDWDKVRKTLPGMFKRIIDVCKANYGHQISYAATPPEANEGLIPWENPAFESVGIDAYIHDFLGWDETWMIALLDRLKRFRKPVHCADFGMMSYAGADKFGGWSPLYSSQYPYDEEPQARFTKRTLEMLNRAKIDGCFWVQYNEQGFDKGHALYNPLTRKRKKGFYMYKSYQRTS